MSDPKARSGTDVTSRVTQGVNESLPQYRQSVLKGIAPTEQKLLDVSKQITPGYNNLQTQQFAQQAPKLAQTGLQVEQTLNPEFTAARSQAGGKLGELLGSINLNNANPEAERLVSQEAARSGNLGGPPNATNTVANALSFGKELDARRQSLGNAIGTATGFMPASRINSNDSVGKFLGVQRPGNQAFNMGNDLLGVSSQAQFQKNDLNSQRRDILDRMNETTSSVGSLVGSC